MLRILMTLALFTLASAPRAQAEITPWLFDLREPFNACIQGAPQNPYSTCQDALSDSYTLRREIGNALQICLNANVEGCVAAFDDAGFPADTLNIATLAPCAMLGDLDKVEALELPEGSCIEQIAREIETNRIPTTHNAEIPCGFISIECMEIVSKGADYWEAALRILHLDKLQAVIASNDYDNTTRHRYYSLLERQHWQQIELAKTTCHLATVIPHRANERDYSDCLGQAYSRLWQQMKTVTD